MVPNDLLIHKSWMLLGEFLAPTLEQVGKSRKRFLQQVILRPAPDAARPRCRYQADTGGPSHVPLDYLWDMEGHFATEDICQAVCFALAHMTAEEAE